jgi:hypothetical protein
VVASPAKRAAYSVIILVSGSNHRFETKPTRSPAKAGLFISAKVYGSE